MDMILRRQSVMEAERSNFEAQWQDVATYLLPRQADFLGDSFAQGARRTGRIFDEAGLQSLNDGIAVFEGYVMPRGARWQNLEARDPELMKKRSVREWYERKTGQLFALRSDPQSGFDTQCHESIASLMGFGNQAMTPSIRRDLRGRIAGIGYRSEHLGGIFILENAWGRPDVVHRKFKLEARQALQEFGDKAPECVLKAMKDKREHEKHWYLQAIEPNRRFEPGRLDHAGKPVASAYIAVQDKQLIEVGGYRSMPTIASRFEKSPMETYGRGPGMDVLPAVKAAQRMMQDLVTAVEFLARPPLGAHDDMLDQTIRYSPHGVTYGAIDRQGNKLIQPLLDGANIAPALQLQERTREVIRRAFYGDMLRIRQEQKTHLIEADVMEQLQEKGVLLAPLGRQETEWLSPMGEREIDLMWEMGMLSDMPPEVQEAGGLYQMRYDNPLARAQKAEQAAGFFRTLQGVTPLIQAKPQLIDAFLARFPFDGVLNGLAYINGVPASWEADDDQRTQATAAAGESANAQQLLAAAPVIAKTAKELSLAQGGAGGAL
ncbi:hypothetical protein FHS98_002718 [Sphingomonas oligoaromativorans]|nr:hypothetical protein [Sphingomonas oligoaromativorans]